MERRRTYDRAYRAANADYRERELLRRRQGKRLQAIARDRMRITELHDFLAALIGPHGYHPTDDPGLHLLGGRSR
jgi:hypothetical protein